MVWVVPLLAMDLSTHCLTAAAVMPAFGVHEGLRSEERRVVCAGGRATNRARGLHRLPTPDELRMPALQQRQ